MSKLTAQLTPHQHLRGQVFGPEKLGTVLSATVAGIGTPERTWISANLDSLIAETDPGWLATLAASSIGQKIAYLEAWRDNILTAITEKNVAPGTPQPFRTISELVDQIKLGYLCDLYWGEYTDL